MKKREKERLSRHKLVRTRELSFFVRDGTAVLELEMENWTHGGFGDGARATSGQSHSEPPQQVGFPGDPTNCRDSGNVGLELAFKPKARLYV